MTRGSCAAAVVLALVAVAPAYGQVQGVPPVPDPDSAPVRIGSLWMKPSIVLANLGADTNVFNESDADDPKSDFTFTLTPRADLFLRMSRSWLIGTIREDLVWYNTYADQRSVNDLYSLDWLVPLSRVAFDVGGSYLDTRERPGFEIDARADRAETTANAAVELRVLSKTLFGGRGFWKNVRFDENQLFDDADLAAELNRRETTAAITIRHELTPLTNLTVDIARQQDRFETSPERDADTTRIDGGIRFDPFALINGSAQVGFKRFQPLAADLPGYTGLTLAVNLSYVVLESTKLAVSATRDVQYSYEQDQPYYLLSGMQASFAQQIYGPLDMEGRFGTERLAYQDREGVPAGGIEAPNRVDRVRTYGFGAGYRIGRDLRVGFNVDNARRISDLDDRQYEGLRYGLSVAYGR